MFGADAEHRTHGRSLLPVIEGRASAVRDYVLCGVWGREVHLIDDRYKYARAPGDGNAPLSLWSNRWSTMPVPSRPNLRLPPPDERAALDRMPGSRIPVIRQPFRQGDLLPYWAIAPFSGNHLYDLQDDPAEEQNRAGEQAERQQADKLREVLREVDAPDDQLIRLGMT